MTINLVDDYGVWPNTIEGRLIRIVKDLESLFSKEIIENIEDRDSLQNQTSFQKTQRSPKHNELPLP